jgi:hypothetical protein
MSCESGTDSGQTENALVAIMQHRPLLLPPHRQRPLQPLQHHPLIRPSAEDRLDKVRCQQRQSQDAADVALADLLRLGDFGDGAIYSRCPADSATAKPALAPRPASRPVVACSVVSARCRPAPGSACDRAAGRAACESAPPRCRPGAGSRRAWIRPPFAAAGTVCSRSSATRLANRPGTAANHVPALAENCGGEAMARSRQIGTCGPAVRHRIVHLVRAVHIAGG